MLDVRLSFWQCPSCGGLRIPDANLRYPEVEPDASGGTPLVMRLLMRYRLVWLRATVPQVKNAAVRVLDAGCGDGQWLEFLQSAGYNGCTGVEVSRRRLAHARQRGLTVYPTLTEALSRDSAFDVIFLWQVAEHIPQPFSLISELLDALAPGGVLIVSVPNQDSWQIRLFGERSSLIDYGRHVWYWDTAFFHRASTLLPGTVVRRIPEWNYEYEIYSWTDTLVSLLVGRHHFVHTRLKKGEGSRAGRAVAAVLCAIALPLAVVLSIVTLAVPRRSSTQTYLFSRAKP